MVEGNKARGKYWTILFTRVFFQRLSQGKLVDPNRTVATETKNEQFRFNDINKHPQEQPHSQFV